MRVRIGIHSGEASTAGERYIGFSVHRAARIGALGHGGQILLSSATRELVEDDLPDGVTLRDLGGRRLKDVQRPERIAQVVAPGLQSKFPPLGPRRSSNRHARVLVAAACLAIAAATTLGLLLVGVHSGSPKAAAGVAADSVGVFESSSGKRVGEAAVETSPGAIAADDEVVWIANADGHSVSRLDPATDAVVQTITVGNGPAGVAIGGGFVWVTNSLDGTVTQIDPQTNVAVRRGIPVGSQPGGIAYGLGGVWVANINDRTVMRIDPDSGKPGRPIPVGAGVDALAIGDGSLWAASELGGTVARIDRQSGSSQTINVGRGPDAIAVGPDAVWVANNLDGTVSRIDPATNRVVATIDVGQGPVGIAISPGHGDVWVSSELNDTLSKIDARRAVVVQTVKLSNRPEGIALAPRRMYVAVRTSGLAHRGGTLTVAQDFPLGDIGPEAEVIDPAHAFLLPLWQMLRATNDGLVSYRRAGGGEGAALVPDLATSLPVPTDNGRTYTFELRTGIHYSTGGVVRPADFRRAIERALMSNDGAGYYLAGIKGGAACHKTPKRCDLSGGITTGANTVTFHLVAPDPEFLYKLALPPADAVPAETPFKAHLPLPATGPYMFTRFDPKRQLIVLVRNPRFRQWSAAAQPDGYPDRIVEHWGFTADQAVRAVENGRADLMGVDAGVSAPLLAALRIRDRGRLHANPVLTNVGISLNTRVAPFNDVRVRRALNYAVDRRRFVAIQGGPDLATPSCQRLPPNMIGYRPYCPYMSGGQAGAPYTGPDLTRARQLVAASHTRGETVILQYYRGFSSPQVKLREYLMQVLRRLGYDARLSRVTMKAFWAKGSDSRSGWQTAPWGWTADYAGPSTFFTSLLTCASFKPGTPNNPNPSEFCDHRVDREIAEALTLGSEQARAAAALWAKIDRDVTDQAPSVPTVDLRNLDFVSRRVGNYVFSTADASVLLDQLWVR